MDLPPGMLIMELHPSPEVTYKVYQTKILQEVYHLLVPRVPYLSKIHIQVPHKNGVFPREEIKCLLKVWKVIQGSRGKVSSNEGCPMNSGDNFAAHHV